MGNNGNGKHWRQRIKQEFVNAFGNRCCVCKESYPLAVYDFHHVNPDDKKFAISQAWSANDLLLEEIVKCVMVCSNCHRQVETGLENIPKNAIRFKEKNLKHCQKIFGSKEKEVDS